MSMKNVAIAALALLWPVFGLVSNAKAANPPANADELVADHLDSIASAAVRAGLKTRGVQGPVEFRILVGGAGVLDGKAQIASDGKKLVFLMKLPNNEYRASSSSSTAIKIRLHSRAPSKPVLLSGISCLCRMR